MSEQDYHERLRQISLHNPIVHNLFTMYHRGDFTSLEECLLHMAIALAEQNRKLLDLAVDAKMRESFSAIFPAKLDSHTDK